MTKPTNTFLAGLAALAALVGFKFHVDPAKPPDPDPFGPSILTDERDKDQTRTGEGGPHYDLPGQHLGLDERQISDVSDPPTPSTQVAYDPNNPFGVPVDQPAPTSFIEFGFSSNEERNETPDYEDGDPSTEESHP